jgi:hypothetical protein
MRQHRSVLQMAKRNDVDPLAWLTQTLERIANKVADLPDR